MLFITMAYPHKKYQEKRLWCSCMGVLDALSKDDGAKKYSRKQKQNDNDDPMD